MCHLIDEQADQTTHLLLAVEIYQITPKIKDFNTKIRRVSKRPQIGGLHLEFQILNLAIKVKVDTIHPLEQFNKLTQLSKIGIDLTIAAVGTNLLTFLKVRQDWREKVR